MKSTVKDHLPDTLGSEERRLLEIFARYGRDGRAITTASLAVHAAMTNYERLHAAVKTLVLHGFITEAGNDPLVDGPIAYRLSQKESHSKRNEHLKEVCDDVALAPRAYRGSTNSLKKEPVNKT